MTLGSDHTESLLTVSIQLLSYKESFIYFLIIPLLHLDIHGWMVDGNEKGEFNWPPETGTLFHLIGSKGGDTHSIQMEKQLKDEFFTFN